MHLQPEARARGAGVLTLLAASLLLGACSSVAPRREAATVAAPPADSVPSAAPESPQPPDIPSAPAPRKAPEPPVPTAWERLRAGYAFSKCDADSGVARWQARYTRGPDRFAASVQRSLPSLEFVLEQLERRKLPTEFALLPIVESWYQPVRSSGNRPAGIWQIMPVTGRHLGLEISADYDGRLDLAASTRAALDLLEHLAEAFHRDWRLVNMAYNAGEFRIRRSLAGRVRNDGSIAYGSLPVSRITHEHLAKLQAVACILRHPARFEVQLPSFDPDQALVAIPVEAALDVELAAQLAGMPLSDFRRLNPAALGPVLRSSRQVVLPTARAESFKRLLARVPTTDRTGWRRRTLARPVAWSTLAQGSGPDAETLAAIHHAPQPGTKASGSVLVRSSATTSSPAQSAAIAAPASGKYAVLAGDSLWRIARRFGVALESLLGWNRLDSADVLVPGQLLWITEPRLD